MAVDGAKVVAQRMRRAAPADRRLSSCAIDESATACALLVTGNQDRAFGDPLAAVQPGVRFAETFWRPPADVCESATTIVVTVDLAGIDQDDLDVVLFEDALIVEGRRRLPADPGRLPHRRDSPGPFRLELGLPGASTRSASMRAMTWACCASPF